MSDDLTASLKTLRNAASSLNKLTDQANKSVQLIENFLSNEYHIGTDAFVRVKGVIGYGPLLGYRKISARYRIVVGYGDGKPDPKTVVPWSDCSRDIKLETIKKLPDLISRMSGILEQGVEEAKLANESINKILKTMTGKED